MKKIIYLRSTAVFVQLVILISSIASSAQVTWQQFPGPNRGEAVLFTALPNGSIIASSDRFYITTNKGLSWSPFSPPFSNNGWVGNQAVAYNSKGRIFANGDPGVYTTSDNGANWSHIAETEFTLYNEGALMVDASDNLYVSNYKNGKRVLERSTDDGATWTVLAHDFPQYRNLLYASSAGSIFVANYNGLERSTNGGASWTKLSITSGDQRIDGICGSGSLIYTVCDYVLYRSTDDGATWTSISAGLPTLRGVGAMAANGNGLMICATPGGIFRSLDKGQEWGAVIGPKDSTGQTYASALLPIDDGSYLVSLDDGVHGSVDGHAFTTLQNGMLNTFAESVTTTPTGEIFVWNYPGGIVSTTDDGQNWTQKSAGIAVTQADNAKLQSGYRNDMYASNFTGAYRSTDDGNSWIAVTQPAGVMPLILIPANNGLLYGYNYTANGKSSGLYTKEFVSSDFGTSWTEITGTLDTFAVSGGMAIDSNGTIYVGLSNSVTVVANEGFVQQNATIAVSTDQGATWHRCENLADILLRTKILYCSVSNINIDPAGDILVAHSNGVAVSTDGGANWSNSPYLDQTQFVVSNSKSHLFAGTRESGVWESTDMGQSWTDISGTVPKTGTSSLYIDKKDYLMVGAGGSGVFKTVQHTNSIHHTASVQSTSAQVLTLEAAFPNPSSSQVSIEFNLPHQGLSNLSLRDATGREVLSQRGSYPAGRNRVALNIQWLPNGLYECRLTTDEGDRSSFVTVIR